MAKTFLVDTTRCTACRGCQIACKEWHNLPAVKTYQTGTHQNPPDLNAFNLKVVRFREHLDESGSVRWNFFPDQCRHCLNPPCKDVADMILEGAIVQDEKTGAVLFTRETASLSQEDFEAIREVCPYNIPRRNEETGVMAKCDMCIDRVRAGMLPMCVKTCPTGTMAFGEREEILDLARRRLAEARKRFPKAFLADAQDVRVVYLLAEEKRHYHDYACF